MVTQPAGATSGENLTSHMDLQLVMLLSIHAGGTAVVTGLTNGDYKVAVQIQIHLHYKI